MRSGQTQVLKTSVWGLRSFFLSREFVCKNCTSKTECGIVFSVKSYPKPPELFSKKKNFARFPEFRNFRDLGPRYRQSVVTTSDGGRLKIGGVSGWPAGRNLWGKRTSPSHSASKTGSDAQRTAPCKFVLLRSRRFLIFGRRYRQSVSTASDGSRLKIDWFSGWSAGRNL